MTMYVLLNMYIQYVPPIERQWIEEWIKDDKKFTTISLKVAASKQVFGIEDFSEVYWRILKTRPGVL